MKRKCGKTCKNIVLKFVEFDNRDNRAAKMQDICHLIGQGMKVASVNNGTFTTPGSFNHPRGEVLEGLWFTLVRGK